jgi:hypothetical protein
MCFVAAYTSGAKGVNPVPLTAKGMNPMLLNKKTDLVASSEEDRIRNIVLFRHIFSRKYRQHLRLMVVRPHTGSLGEEAISTMFWIPQIKKPFWGDFCTHVPSEDCPISTIRKRISAAYTVTVKDEPAIDTNQPTNGLALHAGTSQDHRLNHPG